MVLSGLNILKVVLAIMMLLCLADMPYGYYLLVRTVSAGAFAYFAFDAYKREKSELIFVYVGLALLFQPLVKIALGRELWNLVDVIVAMFLLGTIWFENQKMKEEHSSK
jgi:hypothetical protein